ncbi:YcaO-related McrA-glycine thioamidation protein [uncultured Methanobrevibacter sp.]|uniref:YcaO-related McrA-glycine thioamidation protein n=1 Tax=uncultured Methanobrevibacter sp. TaxID=253161 RepID=UPI0026090256|nr:YcaO-related McrA-glycine thioamidation protein [uncultured Methanobrevibacter sp.]
MENQEITFFKGTHRVIPPSKTIKKNEHKTKIAGITRITEITHLDRIGIPVFSAIRPTAQDGGISIYGGKGITSNHAKASAMMEGFERYSAEKQESDKTIIATLNEINGNYINPKSLNLPRDFSEDLLETMNLEWSMSKDLISGEDYYIPSNAIYHPYVPENNVQGLFKGNTNGLASGNILEEAILHGIFEVIERDAWSIFELTHKNSKQIDLESIDNDNIIQLLNKYHENGINIKLMNLTADINVPTIAASADDTVLKDAGLLSLGIGTHLNPGIAILRALTEVAQSRATQIQGAREDTVRADFARKAGYERMKRINNHYFEDETDKLSFSDIEDKSTNSINQDIEIVKDELIKNGLDKILYTDLTRPELGVNVVRVVIPTMELYSLDNTRAGDRCLKF